jgi:hypothetical protein
MVRTVQKRGAMLLVAVFTCCLTTLAQQPSYPKEIRGYKVARLEVEVKKNGKKTTNEQPSSEPGHGAFIRLGNPQLARVTPLGISFEIPIVVTPVKQKGHVDFLVFEEMLVNDTSVEIDEYHRGFDLPNKELLTLTEPLRFYVYLPSAVLGAIDEWSDSKKTWLITGRVYVFGKFKKSIFSFKRCIPIELNVTIPNPLQQ